MCLFDIKWKVLYLRRSKGNGKLVACLLRELGRIWFNKKNMITIILFLLFKDSVYINRVLVHIMRNY